MGRIPSLERFQRDPYGISRIMWSLMNLTKSLNVEGFGLFDTLTIVSSMFTAIEPHAE